MPIDLRLQHVTTNVSVGLEKFFKRKFLSSKKVETPSQIESQQIKWDYLIAFLSCTAVGFMQLCNLGTRLSAPIGMIYFHFDTGSCVVSYSVQCRIPVLLFFTKEQCRPCSTTIGLFLHILIWRPRLGVGTIVAAHVCIESDFCVRG